MNNNNLANKILQDADLRTQIGKQLTGLYEDKQSWDPTWRLLQQFINPYRGRLDDDNDNDGARKDAQRKVMLDPYPMEAHRICAAGIQGGLTSPGRPWFAVSLLDEERSKNHDMRIWLDICHDMMMTIFAKGNIYGTYYHTYEELGQFGTGAALLYEDYNTAMWCKPLTIGEYAAGVDYRNRVCRLARKFKLTAGQMVQEFGYDNVSSSVQTAYKNKNMTNRFPVYNLIEQHTSYDKEIIAYGNFPWRSYYWEPGVNDKTFLRVSGFYECPFIMPRWATISNNVYGYGPGHVALGNCMQIQKMDKGKLRIIDNEADPPVVIPTEMEKVDRLPGGLNRVPANTNFKIQNLYQPNQGYEKIAAEIESKHRQISNAFFNDLFIMLANSNNTNMTAREVAERHEEKLLMLGPVLDQMNNEVLSPSVKRLFGICLRNGIFPPPPEPINEEELKIEYISILAQAQKMVEIPAIEKHMGFVGNMAGPFPAVLDNYNPDVITREHANLSGVKAKLLRPEDEVEQIRKQRAEAEEQEKVTAEMAALAQNAKPAADAARLLSETNVSSDNILGTLLGGGGAHE